MFICRFEMGLEQPLRQLLAGHLNSGLKENLDQ
jgi:hypothetical protein